MNCRIFTTICLALMGSVACSAVYANIPTAERNVLLALYTSTNGAAWATSTGWNGAAGTECTWYGVSCDVTSSHVVSIVLENNKLTGTLPSLSALAALDTFVVGTFSDCGVGNQNQIAGPFPDLSSLTALTIFAAG